MLVLISFVLVLVATGLLVVGLLQDQGGLTLIYFSIGASIVAGIILAVAVKVARPKGDAPSAPAPLPKQREDVPARTGGATPGRQAPAPPTQNSAPVSGDAVTETVPAVPERPEPVVPAVVAADDDVDADDEFFPIADYDELRVGEIIPLLPELYADELDVVEARERAGRNRTSIINRLEALRKTASAGDDDEGGEPIPVPAVGDEEWAAADDDWDDAGDDFPILDYDELRVGQVRDLLPALSEDELVEVREREVAGANRKMIVSAINDRLAGAAPAPAKKA
ncbi:MAG: hypothetical protein WD232_00685, partial [Acidimicrobiales bacterium]